MNGTLCLMRYAVLPHWLSTCLCVVCEYICHIICTPRDSPLIYIIQTLMYIHTSIRIMLGTQPLRASRVSENKSRCVCFCFFFIIANDTRNSSWWKLRAIKSFAIGIKRNDSLLTKQRRKGNDGEVKWW